MFFSLKDTVKWIDDNDHHFLLFPKSIFFLINFILYTTYTYQLDYLADVWNLSITSSGFITSIPIISFFFAIAWSSLAQRTGLYKEIIVVVVGVYALCFTSFNLLSPLMSGADIWKRFVTASLIYGSMSILASAVFPLLDHKMFVKLSKDKRFSPEMFGRQRLWGTVGQGVAGFVSGWGIKNYGYSAIFLLSATASIIFIVLIILGFESSVSVPVPDKGEDKKEGHDNIDEKASPVKQISWAVSMKRLMTVQFVSFLLVILVASYARAIVGNYLMRYLQICLNISKDKSGFLLLTRSLPEILCFFFSKNMLHIFGVKNLLLVAQLAGLVRVTTYAWLPETENGKWAPFAVESLRGVNNAFLMASGVRLAHDLAPLDAQTVAQGFFHGIFGNLTTGTAGILASLVSLHVRKVSPEASEADIIRVIFKVSSAASMFGLFVFAAFAFISRKKVPKQQG